MKDDDYAYTLWTLTDPREDDARDCLDVIIVNAALGHIQAIEYENKKVFIISEEQYRKLGNRSSEELTET